MKLKPWYQYRIEEGGYTFEEMDHLFMLCFKLSKRLRRFLALKICSDGIIWRTPVEVKEWRGIYGCCSE